jgi:hypothetical protein
MSNEMTAETIAYSGPAAEWDAGDQARFRELAGKAFLRVDENGNAVVRTADGHETVVYPGWLVLAPEGIPPLFSAPDRVRVTSG